MQACLKCKCTFNLFAVVWSVNVEANVLAADPLSPYMAVVDNDQKCKYMNMYTYKFLHISILRLWNEWENSEEMIIVNSSIHLTFLKIIICVFSFQCMSLSLQVQTLFIPSPQYPNPQSLVQYSYLKKRRVLARGHK